MSQKILEEWTILIVWLEGPCQYNSGTPWHREWTNLVNFAGVETGIFTTFSPEYFSLNCRFNAAVALTTMKLTDSALTCVSVKSNCHGMAPGMAVGREGQVWMGKILWDVHSGWMVMNGGREKGSCEYSHETEPRSPFHPGRVGTVWTCLRKATPRRRFEPGWIAKAALWRWNRTGHQGNF